MNGGKMSTDERKMKRQISNIFLNLTALTPESVDPIAPSGGAIRADYWMAINTAPPHYTACRLHARCQCPIFGKTESTRHYENDRHEQTCIVQL